MIFARTTTGSGSGPTLWARNGWTRWHVVVGLPLIALAAWITRLAWSDIYHIALDDKEASHIFLVPIVFLWLVWVRKERLRACKPERTWIGPLVVAIGWFLYAYGDLYLFQAFWHAGAVLIVLGSFLSVAGVQMLKKFLPAFAVLMFLVPVPGVIRQSPSLQLQSITAQVTHGILQFFGTEVDLKGTVLEISNPQEGIVKVGIVEACNGMRMVFALVLVSFAFAYGTPLREFVRFLILLASPVSAILCNVVRLVPTVWIYGHSTRAVGDWFHDITGWVMLPIAFFFLMGIIRVLRWALIPVTKFTLAYGS